MTYVSSLSAPPATAVAQSRKHRPNLVNLPVSNVPAPPSSVFTFYCQKENYSENQASLTNRASFLMISSNHKRAIAYCKYGCAQGLDSQAQKPHFRLDDAWMDRSVIKSSS